ncbi:MAG TPA: class I SAM-dependent methyltransferase [Chthoniobacterales bacterium]|jgi:hypothetical protein
MPDSLDITSIAVSPTIGFAAQIQTAFDRALADESKVDSEVLSIRGMSGKKYRRFINNLMELIPAPRYLEIGAWQGSTLCSAIFGNEITATCVDNWSEFGGPFDKFLTNLAKFKGKSRVTFIEKDYRELDFHHLGLFNVYLFDGPHAYEDQFDGVMMADPALEDCFVLIVDDWNWDEARRGTMDAIRKLDYQIDYAFEVRTSRDNSLPELRGEKSDWHNGYFIGALRKTRQVQA